MAHVTNFEMPVLGSDNETERESKPRFPKWCIRIRGLMQFLANSVIRLYLKVFPNKQQPCFPFLELPGEIRIKIYREILLSETARSCKIGITEPSEPINISCINRQIKCEASHVFKSHTQTTIGIGSCLWRLALPTKYSRFPSCDLETLVLDMISSGGLDLNVIEDVELEIHLPPSPTVLAYLYANLAAVCNAFGQLPQLRNITIDGSKFAKLPLSMCNVPLRPLIVFRRKYPDVPISVVGGSIVWTEMLAAIQSTESEYIDIDQWQKTLRNLQDYRSYESREERSTGSHGRHRVNNTGSVATSTDRTKTCRRGDAHNDRPSQKS